MNIKSLLHSIKEQGLSATWHHLRHRLGIRLEEKRRGIQTEALIPLEQFGLGHPERREYAATLYSDFDVIRASLAVREGKDVFVDYGAGMGRAVILAAELPFKRVIGVELSPELAQTAAQNVQAAASKLRCADVEVVVADATEFPVPEDASIFYFNNPFFGQILDKVLANIQESHRDHPRDIHLVCNLPGVCAFDGQIRKVGWLKLEREAALSDGRQCLVFAVQQ